MKQKTYHGYRDGYRTSEPLIVFVHDGEGERRPLPGVWEPGTWDRGPASSGATLALDLQGLP